MKRIIIVFLVAISVMTFTQVVVPLPIFSVPDFDQRNGIIEVFYEVLENNSTISVTVVFRDEDYPCFLANILYDVYRYFRYGRIVDIETFYLHLSAEGTVTVVEFPGVFSGDHTFKDTKNLHGSASFTATEITFIDGRPLIYVNTWNHMFGVRASFDKKYEKMIFDYPITRGGRLEAERKYSWLY
ncbi:hypothetical protein [Kosmotoga pacifica]|uniref:Uncharacterized protein n=1 Tax=Kosmotoga pacifica TaxID=1330330 RepID=A0A0G2ZAZ9_9BACT|nr:hypothetical protein [Kosmotoga pacifica]AKI97276.1 hypothetical protein IX53_04985 [Kosmotoga pacifica]